MVLRSYCGVQIQNFKLSTRSVFLFYNNSALCHMVVKRRVGAGAKSNLDRVEVESEKNQCIMIFYYSSNNNNSDVSLLCEELLNCYTARVVTHYCCVTVQQGHYTVL